MKLTVVAQQLPVKPPVQLTGQPEKHNGPALSGDGKSPLPCNQK